MSVPLGHVNGRNLVIASVATSTEPSINYQESLDMPSERPNGGDLYPGDLWYNEVDDILYIFTTMGWSPVNQPPSVTKEYVDAIGQDLADKIQQLDTLCATLSDRIDQLELSSATEAYVDSAAQELDNKILQIDTLAATIDSRVDDTETVLIDHEQRLMDGGL